jgi:hypothetical protein
MLTNELSGKARVGIFWAVEGVIVGDTVCLAEAEEYGDALQYGGHYEFREQLKAKTEAERKLKAHAYDYYPRGRMVWFPKRRTARLYVDSWMTLSGKRPWISLSMKRTASKSRGTLITAVPGAIGTIWNKRS